MFAACVRNFRSVYVKRLTCANPFRYELVRLAVRLARMWGSARLPIESAYALHELICAEWVCACVCAYV